MTVTPPSLSLRRKFGVFRSQVRFLSPWSVACCVIIATLWIWAAWTVHSERAGIRNRAYVTAVAQARTYADQIGRSIGQLDYIMLSLQFHWQKNGGRLNLQEQLQAGLVPKATQISLWMFDQHGRLVTTTNLHVKPNQGISSRDYFKAHAASPSKKLAISKVMRSLLLDQDVIILSRRLNAPDGSFAGLMVASVDPAFLVSFVDETNIGVDGFVSIRSDVGDFFATKTKGGVRTKNPKLIGSPVPDGPQGIEYRGAERYFDRKARIVAWKVVLDYPIMALVGFSEAALLEEYVPRTREVLLFAIAISLPLLFIVASGMRRSAMRASKVQYAREMHEAYRIATEHAKEGFYMLRALYGPGGEIVDFLIEDCNERGALVRRLPREALVGKTLSAAFPGIFETHLLGQFRKAMETGYFEDEYHVPQREGEALQWLQRRLVRTSTGLAVTLRDITESKLHQAALVQLANDDAVTALPNRHWLMSYLPTAVENARSKGTLLAVLFVDLDDFKNINDTLGHAVGDQLLGAAAARLKAVIGPEDNIARLGGDEFTIIVEAAQTRDEVVAAAERVIDALRSPFVLGTGQCQYFVHATVGVSLFPEDGANGATLLKHADIAMYAAKESGKGTYRFFDPGMERRLVTRLNRESELKLAIERHELVLHYQPRVKSDTGEITSMEALVRWTHPVLGLIPPNDFIPMAEETGLIVPLGTEVIRMACAQQALWKGQGLAVVPVSVNVSARQIDTGVVSAVLAAALKANALEGSLLEVEVTESATVTEDGMAVTELAAIQKAGIKVYVDDFGTGFSCLAQLKRLDMDGLKVDRAFTSQLLNSPEDAALFQAIVSMAHALGMRVVAEGVETAEQLAALQSLSCEEVQGYFISRPVPAANAAHFLQKRFLFPDVLMES
jgi:diguanylate cyclase (GGDEF)-like protein